MDSSYRPLPEIKAADSSAPRPSVWRRLKCWLRSLFATLHKLSPSPPKPPSRPRTPIEKPPARLPPPKLNLIIPTLKPTRNDLNRSRPFPRLASPIGGEPNPNRKKKALLIGIAYEDCEADYLRGPHRDVRELKALLLEVYGYEEDDVTVMLDDEHSKGGPLEPTRLNILAQIQELVTDAMPGDHFCFHYSGHSSQIENNDNTEEDGMDEVILTSDCTADEDVYIVDDELRRSLVDKLPPGSSLVALFDTCHSASLLDLTHSRCNRVYVPWMSKGKRRTDSLRRAVVRHHALPPRTPSSKSNRVIACAGLIGTRTSSPKTATTGTTERDESASIPSTPFSNPNPNKFERAHLQSLQTFQPLRIADEVALGREDILRRSSLTASSPKLPAPSLLPSIPLLLLPHQNYSLSPSPSSSLRTSAQTNRSRNTWGVSPTVDRKCTSPDRMFPCTGYCEPSPTERAYVVCLSAAKDSQISWEDGAGTGLTRIVINILRENPHPSLRKLMEDVSYDVYELLRRLHATHWKLRSERRAAGIGGGFGAPRAKNVGEEGGEGAQEGGDDEVEFETENFQNPQISSHKPLDMNAVFTL